MAEFNPKTKEIELSDEDKDALRNGLGKNWATNIINKIIWGDKEHFYDKR